MASASVVGQHPGLHRLDSEPQLLFLKLSSAKKKIPLPRKSSWEKMMSRRSSGSRGDGGSGAHPTSPGPPLEPALTGDGRVSPDRSRHADRRADDSGTELPWDLNRNAGGRRGSSAVDVMVSGLRAAHRPRDAPRGRRDTWSGDGTRQGIPSSAPEPAGRSGLPLERLTQGRTGVVRLARTEPPRMEAWSIFPRRTDPRMRAERGEGHRFEAKPVTQDWCDACSRQITAQALKCQNCSYTCHLECERKVQLDCNQRGKETEQTPFPRRQCTATAPQQKQNEAKEDEDRKKDLSEEEVRTRIKEYNCQVPETGMKLAPDGSFTGFIKVHLRLSRPVTVVEALGSEGASRQAEGCGQATTECRGGTDCEPSDKRTSFYLPSDCVTQLHVSSATTTREVIQGLLKKFMVLDNPGKFALYRQAHRDGQDLFQKLPLCECPLLLRLLAGPDPQLLRFVLKEKETGEVEWHAFSVPELQNFLMILEKEEAERVRAVEEKYSLHRQKLQQAIEQYDS